MSSAHLHCSTDRGTPESIDSQFVVRNFWYQQPSATATDSGSDTDAGSHRRCRHRSVNSISIRATLSPLARASRLPFPDVLLRRLLRRSHGPRPIETFRLPKPSHFQAVAKTAFPTGTMSHFGGAFSLSWQRPLSCADSTSGEDDRKLCLLVRPRGCTRRSSPAPDAIARMSRARQHHPKH